MSYRIFPILMTFIFFFTCCQQIEAQERSVKLFANLFRSTHTPQLFENKNPEFRGLSLAYKVLKNGITQEVEARFNAKSRSLPDDTFKSWEAQIRYEIGKYWTLSDRIFIQRGLATSLYYLGEEINVATFNTFPQKNTKSGVELALLFHFEFHLTNKIYLDLNTNLLAANVGVNFAEIENPNLTENQQRQGGFDFDLTAVSMFRIGVGYILNNANKANEVLKD